MMTPEQLQEIENRWAKATPGPWVDYRKKWNSLVEEGRKRTGNWWHGTKNRSLAITLIRPKFWHGKDIEEINTVENAPDLWDKGVLAQTWSLTKNNLYYNSQFLDDADTEAIAYAPTDIANLIAEVRRLNRMVEIACYKLDDFSYPSTDNASKNWFNWLEKEAEEVK